MKHTRKLFSLLLMAALIATGCQREYFELDRLSDEVELQPGLVAPLLYGSAGVEQLLETIDSTGILDTDEQGLIYLAYSSDAFSVSADTILEVPDELYLQEFVEADINTPAWLSAEVGDTVPFLKRESFSFKLDGKDRLDSVMIKEGVIEINVTSTFKHEGILTVSSSQILDAERDTFSTRFSISEADGSFTEIRNLQSDRFLVKPTLLNDTNYFELNYFLELINSGSPVFPGDFCLITVTWTNQKFYHAYGFFDRRELISESGFLEFSFFEDNPELASIIFNDPKLTLDITSSIGMPLEVEMEDLIATSSRDGSQVELLFDEGNLFLVEAPALAGESRVTQIQVDKQTSNFDELLASAPSRVDYTIRSSTSDTTPPVQHFVLDTSKLNVSLEVLLPLDFKSGGFSISDTLDFELVDEESENNPVERLQLTLTTLNELPVELGVQLYLMDGMYEVIDSVFDAETLILSGSQVDAEGRTAQPGEATAVVVIDSDLIDKLDQVAYLLMEAKMITSGGGDQFVKLYSDYSLDYEISISANLRINTREL